MFSTEDTCQIADAAVIVDAAGKWVIPGLIDTHVHLDWTHPADVQRSQLLRFAFGTTTTREAGTAGSLEQNLGHRRVSQSPEVPEPRLIVSGLLSIAKTEGVDAQDIGGGAHARRVWRRCHQGQGAVHRSAMARDRRYQPRRVTAGVGAHWTEDGSQLNEALAAGIDGVTHVLTFSEYAQRPSDGDSLVPASVEFWVQIKESGRHSIR